VAAPIDTHGDRPETVVEVLQCSSCGAAVSYDVHARAPRCAFCGSEVHVKTPDDPVDQAELFLPFTVDRARAERAFRTWLSGLGWFRPRDLRAASQLESMRPLMWVAWVFDAESLVSWTADSDAAAGRADWAPHAGQTDMRFDDVIGSASRGLTDDETRKLVESYHLPTATNQLPADPVEIVLEQFELPRSSARQQVRAQIRRIVTHRLEGGHIPGTRYRHLHMSILLRRLVTRRMAFPAWVIAYRYRSKLYRFVLSGQDAECLMGDAPLSIAKIAATIVGGVVLLAVLAIVLSLA
jgi:hypothetical protein